MPISYTGDDCQLGIYNVTLSARMSSVLVNITIQDDTILEPKEDFKLNILSTSPQKDTLIIGSPDEAVVIIIDNDGKHCICHESSS